MTCAVNPCRAKATTTLGARPACQPCADDARAFIASSESRIPKFATATIEDELADWARAAFVVEGRT
jgi:hypothetical protein